MSETCEFRVTGRVQGVGFRPFIARLAHTFGVLGWVRNEGSFVRIVAQASTEQLADFQRAIEQQAPAAAMPQVDERIPLPTQPFEQFDIIHSATANHTGILPNLPLDLYTCPDCLAELFDADNRRYHYPFINCTQCGPRYTLIKSLPYDRPATSMAVFTLCEDCQQEYESPLDRRYHAEPTACPVCGPQWRWIGKKQSEPLMAAIQALLDGQVICVKGVGGFHLMTSALNDTGIEQIRQLKSRPDKPLAVLFSDQPDHPAYYSQFIECDTASLARLQDVARPIVLCPAKAENAGRLSQRIHPGLSHIGAMLPYTPLHALLMNHLTFPLVVTSANRSKEPLVYTDEQLTALCDWPALTHDRDILYPADDSLFLANGLPSRLGRGHTPKTLSLPFSIPKPLIALGADDKVTFALARNKQIVLSPHLGSLQSPAGQRLASKTLTHLGALYDINTRDYLIDQHPQYQQRRFLQKQKQTAISEIQHHRAHASALWLDAWQQGRLDSEDLLLVFVWDGTGYGDDGTIWGGETFYGRPSQWQRVASFLPFDLPGGDRCILEPWRVALSVFPEAKLSANIINKPSVLALLQTGQSCATCSSAGRLIDACAALLGIESVSFDAYAAMQLNDIAAGINATPIPLRWKPDENNLARLDWQPLVQWIARHRDNRPLAAATVFASLSQALLIFAEQFRIRSTETIAGIGVTGGVFQSDRINEYLTNTKTTFPLFFHRELPCNDAALSVGQIVEFTGRHYDWKN